MLEALTVSQCYATSKSIRIKKPKIKISVLNNCGFHRDNVPYEWTTP